MKRFTLAAVLAATFASPLAALDIAALTAAERDAFRAEVRAYLLDNPEVLLEAMEVLETRKQDAQATTDQALIHANADALFNDGFSYVGGNPDGDITVVEFLDYRCGYCKKAHPEVSELINSDGNIRIIIKEFPILGEESNLASRFAIAVLQNAGPEAYAQAHDRLMEFRGNITERSLSNMAKKLGLDGDMILAKMQDESVNEVIQANYELGQRMQISGTPSFVMGNQMLRGYVPFNSMKAIVAEQRSK